MTRIDGGPRRAFAQAWLHPRDREILVFRGWVATPGDDRVARPARFGTSEIQHHRGLDWRLGGRNIVAEVDVAVDDGRVLSIRVDQHLRLSAGKNDVICRDRRVALDRHLTGTHGAHADGTNSTIGILRRGCDHNLAGIDKRHGQQTRFSCRWPQLTPFCPESPVVRRCLQIHLPNLRTSISHGRKQPALAVFPSAACLSASTATHRPVTSRIPQTPQHQAFSPAKPADASPPKPHGRQLVFPSFEFSRPNLYHAVRWYQSVPFEAFKRSKPWNDADFFSSQALFSPQDRHQAPSLRRRRK